MTSVPFGGQTAQTPDVRLDETFPLLDLVNRRSAAQLIEAVVTRSKLSRGSDLTAVRCGRWAVRRQGVEPST